MRIRALPWWALAAAALAALLLAGFVGDGYVFRTIGAAIKCCLGLAIGYYAHRHLVMQGRSIDPADDSAAAQSKRLSRAVIMAGCALTMGLAV